MSKSAHELAIDILARRDNSIKEMRTKLRSKKLDSETIEETIIWLIDKRLLNDRDFAQKKAESIMRTKLSGPRYLSNKLREAGIDSDIINEVIDGLATQEEWEQRAKDAIAQWQRIHPKHKDDTVRKQRFLASRGFDRSYF